MIFSDSDQSRLGSHSIRRWPSEPGEPCTPGNSRPAPHARGPVRLVERLTKDSLPIGTEIDVDGYLEQQRPATGPAAMSRFRMEESRVWHRPVPMF